MNKKMANKGFSKGEPPAAFLRPCVWILVELAKRFKKCFLLQSVEDFDIIGNTNKILPDTFNYYRQILVKSSTSYGQKYHFKPQMGNVSIMIMKYR